MHLIIGTYTERLPHIAGRADGILTIGFDAADGRFGEPRPLAAVRNPSYLVVSPSADRVYAVSETPAFDGHRGGGLTAFARDTGTGELTVLNARPTVGDSPCHLALVRGGRFVVTANYGADIGSVTVFPVEAGGRLGDLAAYLEHPGSGPNAERQTNSHAHMIAVDPLTEELLVADLGADTIFCYSVGDTGRLTLTRELRSAPGAGPRHLAFHPDGRHLFVVNELDGTVSVRRREPGGFPELAAVPTLSAGTRAAGDTRAADDTQAAGDTRPAADTRPAGDTSGNSPAAIRVSPSGRHVLVSNRGHDSISAFRFDPATSGLRLAGTTPVDGECPREFILTPDGTRLITASQDSDLLACYAFDDTTGALRLLGRAAVPTPVCLALV